MSEIIKLIEVAKAEVGYLEKKSNSQLDSKTANAGSKNYTKYARDLDNISGFYNGKKNGFAWCDVFVDWCFVKAFGVDRAKALLLQPNKSLGAGCGYSMNYYKNKNQFHSTPKAGDQIFFKNGNSITHTGIVIKTDSARVYTIEGNTSSAAGVVSNGGCVREKSYALNYKYIAGYGRPNYKEEVEQKTEPKTNTTKYIYNCDSLNIRRGAGTNHAAINDLACGTKVTVYETEGTWSRIGSKQWVSSNYLTNKKPNKVYNTKVVTNCSSLNVRSSNKYGKNDNNICKVKCPLPQGTLVSIIETKGNGARIGQNRWVYKSYLK